MINTLVEVKLISFKKGRGLIAKTFIKKGTTIEKAPVVLISNQEYELIKKTILDNYIFEWDNPNDNSENTSAIAMSICEMLNHSYKPNLAYDRDFKNKFIRFYSIKDIIPGEELTINYCGNHETIEPVWFDIE